MPAKRKNRMISTRQPMLMTATGTTGTGKSHFVRHQLLPSLQRPAVVVTYTGMPEIWRDVPSFDSEDPSGWKFDSGIKQVCWFQHEAKTAEHIYKHCKNCLLILDDFKEYGDANLQNNVYFKRIFSSHRHLGLDIVLVAHSPNDVPPQTWMYNKASFIFHTDDIIKKSSIRTASAEHIIAAQARVTAKYSAARKKNNNSHYGIFELVQP